MNASDEALMQDDTLADAVIQGYTPRRRLPAGGFGWTFVAVSESSPEFGDVVLKILKPECGQQELKVIQGIREIVRDCNDLLTVHFVGETLVRDAAQKIPENQYPYILSEFVTYDTLHEYTERFGEIHDDCLVDWVRRIWRAVHFMHAKGWHHGDIHPRNIFVDAASRSVKVGDYSLSGPDDPDARPAEILQSTRAGWGTPGFMAPEVAELKRTPSYRSDVYGLGKLLLYMLTGELPGDSQAISAADARAKGVAPSLAAVIEQATQRNPADRFGSALEMLEAFEKAHADRYLGGSGLQVTLEWQDGAVVKHSFVLVAGRELVIGSANDCTVKLPPAAGRVAERHAQVVRRSTEFLVDAIDGDTRVNGEAVTRRSLRDRDLIEIGDAFVLEFRLFGPTDETGAKVGCARLRVLQSPDDRKADFILIETDVTVGRSETGAAVSLYDRSLSKRHGRLTPKNGRLYYQDLKSRSGSTINGRQSDPEKSQRLNDGDVLAVGEVTLVVRS